MEIRKDSSMPRLTATIKFCSATQSGRDNSSPDRKGLRISVFMAVLAQPFCRKTKMLTPVEGHGWTVGRQRRRVIGFEYQDGSAGVLVDKRAFFLGVPAPEHEYLWRRVAQDMLEQVVGDGLPALAGMRGGLLVFDRQYSIEQQYALGCPVRQVLAGPGRKIGEVAVAFSQYVAKAGRTRNGVWHRERQAMRLSGPVIGILTQNDNTCGVRRRQVQGTKGLVRVNDGPFCQPLIDHVAKLFQGHRTVRGGHGGLPACRQLLDVPVHGLRQAV